MKKLIIFDLDGTLAESKQPIDRGMVSLITQLRYKFLIGIISGCDLSQFKEQFLKRYYLNKLSIWPKFEYDKRWPEFFILPTSGAQLWDVWGQSRIDEVYNNKLTLEEKVSIYNTWGWACKQTDVWDDLSGVDYGEIGEDRGSQVTFSMCGQDAPLEVKEKWDPDGSKRKQIVEFMTAFPDVMREFEIRIGGTTSIDVTRKGIDKEYGVNQLMKCLQINPDEVLFIGDALFEGGNDEAVKKTGVECRVTSGPKETKKIIMELL